MSGLQNTARQPAQIKLASKGKELNINIGKITGMVSVANRSTITNNYVTGRPTKKTYRSGPHGSGPMYSDSDSGSSSDDDAEATAFFARHGTSKPSKKAIKDACRNAPRQRVGTMIIDGRGPPRAFDHSGKQVPLHSQPANTDQTRAPTNPTSQSRKPHVDVPRQTVDWPRPADQFKTTYEQTTIRYISEVDKIQNPHRLVDEAVSHQISQLLGGGWRRVFRHLGLTDAMIDMVHEECREVQDTVYRLLVEWAKNCSSPNINTLVEALVRADQLHVVQQINSLK